VPTDLLLFNGAIYPCGDADPCVSALAIRDGRIVYAGDNGTARSLAGSRTEIVDLRGRCAIPGLSDAHLHLGSLGLALAEVNAETPTLEDALARVAERASDSLPETWIKGRGWNHNVWGGTFPTAAQLDRVSPHNPVCLQSKSGHASWVNSRAMEIAGLGPNTPDPPGGHIVRDTRGQPTGILLEGAAMELIGRHIPSPTNDDMVAAVRRATQEVTRAGLTCVHDMDGIPSFRAEGVLWARGELLLRVVKSIPLDHLDEAVSLGLRTGFGDDYLRIGQVKMFADGALGPRTAWMLEPYETEPRSTGIATTDTEVLRRAALRAAAAGLGCAIHAIGDRACRAVLDILGEAQETYPGPRHRVEHLQILHPDDWARPGKMGIIASMQPLHATSDMPMTDRHLGERAREAYAFKSLLRRGATLAFGSDCPVETVDPLLGIHAAVTRRRRDGSPGPDGWHPQERLTVSEAVKAYTWGAACAAGMEDRLGSLAPGRWADVTILEQNIYKIDPADIPEAVVAGTLIGGRFAFRSSSL